MTNGMAADCSRGEIAAKKEDPPKGAILGQSLYEDGRGAEPGIKGEE